MDPITYHLAHYATRSAAEAQGLWEGQAGGREPVERANWLGDTLTLVRAPDAGFVMWVIEQMREIERQVGTPHPWRWLGLLAANPELTPGLGRALIEQARAAGAPAAPLASAVLALRLTDRLDEGVRAGALVGGAREVPEPSWGRGAAEVARVVDSATDGVAAAIATHDLDGESGGILDLAHRAIGASGWHLAANGSRLRALDLNWAPPLAATIPGAGGQSWSSVAAQRICWTGGSDPWLRDPVMLGWMLDGLRQWGAMPTQGSSYVGAGLLAEPETDLRAAAEECWARSSDLVRIRLVGAPGVGPVLRHRLGAAGVARWLASEDPDIRLAAARALRQRPVKVCWPEGKPAEKLRGPGTGGARWWGWSRGR